MSARISTALQAKFDANRNRTHCSQCGAESSLARYHSEGWCSDCCNADVARCKAARKAELTAMERCSVPNCKHRGNWHTRGVLLCGRHLKRVRAEYAKLGIIGFLASDSIDRGVILEWAKG